SYLGWHEGYVNATPAFALRWDGLELGLGANSQILNGLVETGAPGIPTTGDELGALITSSEVDVLEGETFLQVPVTWNGGWSTLRPAVAATGATGTYALSDQWISSKDLGTITANTPVALSEIIDELDTAGTVAYSGFGVLSTSPATVASLTWGGTTYAFSRSIATIPVGSTVHVTAGEIRPDESTYPGWHEGYANDTPAFSVTEAGLSLGDGASSQIINGFETPLGEADLASLITSAGVAVTSGTVHFQVPIFFGPEATFATLRPAAADVAFAIGDEWISSRDIPATATTPGITKNTPVVLGDLIDAIEANGEVQVLAFGVLAGEPAVVTTVTFNGVEYSFLPAPVVPSGTTPAGTGGAALAATGFEGAWIAPVGALVLALGAGFMLIARRRARQSA
ncbi:MAG TPA: hypothetical protein VFM66_02030, partial [Agromyces sp.]|nr:hypothetical protein [Agromyces sp.]